MMGNARRSFCHYVRSVDSNSGSFTNPLHLLICADGLKLRLAWFDRPHIHPGGAAAGERGADACCSCGPGHADARLPLHQVPGGPHPGAGRRGAAAVNGPLIPSLWGIEAINIGACHGMRLLCFELLTRSASLLMADIVYNLKG